MLDQREEFKVAEEGQHGLSGWYERLLRRHRVGVHALTLIPVYLIAALVLGAATTPGVLFFRFCVERAGGASSFIQALFAGVGMAGGFFLFGFTLIFLVPLVNYPIKAWVRPARGQDHSSRFIAWYLHNALVYLVRYTFLEFITPTPFSILYFRMMGMKLGRNVIINSSNITDPALIVLEDQVTIGGSAVLLAHYGMGGYLILSPVVIRRGVTIGLHAKVMGGVEIGEGSKILPNSVVMPKTLIPPNEIWGGVPAVRVEKSS
jgi:acetyltransferase-like isoleucine patch superfamily enzyme